MPPSRPAGDLLDPDVLGRARTLLRDLGPVIAVSTAVPALAVPLAAAVLTSQRRLVLAPPGAPVPEASAVFGDLVAPPGVPRWEVRLPSPWERLLGKKGTGYPAAAEGLPPSPGGPPPAPEAQEVAERAGLTAASVLLLAMPLHDPHLVGAGLLPALLSGAAVRVATGNVLDAIWREGATHVLCDDRGFADLLAERELADLVARSALHMALVPAPPSDAAARLGRPVLRVGEGEAVARPADEELERLIRETAARVLRLPVEKVGLQHGQGDLPGWDSVAHLDLLVALELATGRRVAARDFVRVRHLGDVRQLFQT